MKTSYAELKRKKKRSRLVFSMIKSNRKTVNLVLNFENRHPGSEFEYFEHRDEVIFWYNGKQKHMHMPKTVFGTRLMIFKAELFMWRIEDDKLH